MPEEKKSSILFRELDVAFVYVIIFVVGIAIVFAMTAYINNKVNEFNDTTITYNK